MFVAKILGLTRLALPIGLGLFLLGVTGDVAHHALPAQLSHQLDPLLGVEASRAHLSTLLGMITLAAALFWKGVRHSDTR